MRPLREVLKHPDVARVVLCEIDERVTRVAARWFPWVEPACADPRVELVFADGCDYIEGHRHEFDLVMVDSTDPVGAAAGLFLRDFYRKVVRALRPGGVVAAQTESPHWNPGMVSTIYAELRTEFEHVSPYVGFVPTYPSGMWSWAWASRDRAHDDHFDARRAEAISTTCRYYNPRIHSAAFALPTFVKSIVKGGAPFEKFDLRHRQIMDARD